MTTTRTASAAGDPLRWFLGVPFRPETYRSLAYLALAFPLGIAYFVGLSVGLSVGAGLLVLLVGVPLLLGTVAAATLVAGFEAELARRLVGVDTEPPEALRSDLADDGLIEGTKRLLLAPTTWTSVLLVALKFAFGVVAFTALVTAGAVLGSMVAAPFVYDTGLTVTFGPYLVDTFEEALALAALAVPLTFVALHLLVGLARLHAQVNAALLGVGREA